MGQQPPDFELLEAKNLVTIVPAIIAILSYVFILRDSLSDYWKGFGEGSIIAIIVLSLYYTYKKKYLQPQSASTRYTG